MDKIIDKILQGQFENDGGTLDFSCQRLEITVKQGEIWKDSFRISVTSGCPAHGWIHTSSARMRVGLSEFKGSSVEVPCQFDSTGMDEGDVLKGELAVVSDHGEYVIPFVVSVGHAMIVSSLGNIKNVFHFANLAKTNWEEAVLLFYRKDFKLILEGNDKQYLSTYLGLSHQKGNQQNVDEFLNAIRKKSKLEFIPEKKEIEIRDFQEMEEDVLTITRNGWGYTKLFVETEGDFLRTEKSMLTDDDFLGNICNLSYFVDKKKLHWGRNEGKIRLHHCYYNVEIPVFVTKDAPQDAWKKNMKEKHLTAKMVHLYLQFRMKAINTAQWLTQSKEVIEELTIIDDKALPARLFQAQLLMTEERFNEAKWMLDHIFQVIEKKQNTLPLDIQAYYLYLTSLYRKEEDYTDYVSRQIDEMRVREPKNWRIAWLTLFLHAEYAIHPGKKWNMLEELIEGGCSSPIIYVEAAQLLNENPTLISNLLDADLQILEFALKKGILSKDVVLQIHYLLTRIRGYSEKLFRVLKGCYGITKDAETLEAVCLLLMKGKKMGPEHFIWYAKAVEKELRIHRLYEFYINAIDLSHEGPLPKLVMMYFAYHSNLDYERNAFLYANVLKHRHTYPEMEIVYRESIERFTLEQLEKGRINKHLAYLYKEIISERIINEDMAVMLSSLMFAHQVVIEGTGITSIVVIHDKLKNERVYPVIKGRSLIPIYSREYKIFLEDKEGNRFVISYDYLLERLLLPGRWIKKVAGFVQNKIELDIYLCEESRNYVSIHQEVVDNYVRLASSDRVTEEYKSEIRTSLIKFLFQNDMIEELDAFLEAAEPAVMTERERAEFVELFIARGMYEKAVSWLKEYGMEALDVKVLLRLCSRLLVRTEFAYDDFMLTMAKHVFKNKKYDENILQYLVANMKGSAKELRNLWRAAVSFEVDVYNLLEHILIQVMFSNAYLGEITEIFEAYATSTPKGSVASAFLTKVAYEYCVLDRVLDGAIFLHVPRLYAAEEATDIAKLAYLKYCTSRDKEILQEQKNMICQFVKDFLWKDICFPFFAEFMDVVPEMESYIDHTFIQYKAKPSSTVVLHYVVEKEGEQGSEYRREEMTNMYGGIFVKSFILFFGEKIQYYITEEDNGRELLTESNEIRKSDTITIRKDNRYSLLNDIVISSALQDYDTCNSLLEEYEKQTCLVNRMFTAI